MGNISIKEYNEQIEIASNFTKIGREEIGSLRELSYRKLKVQQLKNMIDEIKNQEEHGEIKKIKVGEVYIYYYFVLTMKHDDNKIKHEIARELGFEKDYELSINKGKGNSIAELVVTIGKIGNLPQLRNLLNDEYKTTEDIPDDFEEKEILEINMWDKEIRPQIIKIGKKILERYNKDLESTLKKIEEQLKIL